MPPLLMTALFALLLNVVAPNSPVALPHVGKLDKVAAVFAD
jgi:hypothetical protein